MYLFVFNLLFSVSPPGPSDRRPRHVQRHRQQLGRLQAARGPRLSAAAPAALAVVLQPAGALLVAAAPPPPPPTPRRLTDGLTKTHLYKDKSKPFLLSVLHLLSLFSPSFV